MRGKMKRVKKQPDSVFNTYNDSMMEFLNDDSKVKKASLYPHQVEAVLKLHEYFDPQKRSQNASNIALVVLPTGCGKTGVAVLASYALNASRVLVITPSTIISEQIDEAYSNFLVEHNFFTEDDDVDTVDTIAKRRRVPPRDGVVAEYDQDIIDALPPVSLIKKSSEIWKGMRTTVMVVNAHKIGGKSSVKIESIPREGYDLVIVDEAHHYPAPTWKLLVDHFSNSRRLFLTATPLHNGEPILDELDPPPFYYELKRKEAVDNGIIRKVLFDDKAEGDSDEEIYLSIATRMEKFLDEHDRLDPTAKHQGMVITQSKQNTNPAEPFSRVYNDNFPGKCAVYVTDTKNNILDKFKKGEIRTLVIIGRLLEGFDHKCVSVLGIVRNIGPKSRVLFAQFVGRAVRKNSPNDPVSAQIVTHVRFDQRRNFETFEKLAEEDLVGDDDDDEQM